MEKAETRVIQITLFVLAGLVLLFFLLGIVFVFVAVLTDGDWKPWFIAALVAYIVDGFFMKTLKIALSTASAMTKGEGYAKTLRINQLETRDGEAHNGSEGPGGV